MTTTNHADLVFPASPGQQRLWFLHQMNPDSARAYGMAAQAELIGTVDTLALQRALNGVVARHEALRTCLRREGDRLQQIVHDGVSVSLQERDLRSVPERERAAQRDRILAHVARRGWDLNTAPLIRATLVRTDDRHAVLALCVHHAVCDGMSLQIVLDELFTDYQAIRNGDSVDSRKEPLQFADFVVWSAGGEQPDPGWLEEQQRQLEYWRTRLAGLPEGVDLPYDRDRPARQSFDGARCAFTFGANEAEELRRCAAGLRVSLSSLLLSAFVVVVARNGGADDVAVGIPVANRRHEELAGTVGYLANTGVVRAEIGDVSLRELAQRLHTDVGALMQHSDVPFGRVVEALNPPRLIDRNPVFSVMFGFQPDIRRTYHLSDLTVRIDDLDTGTTRVDLSLFAFEQPRGEIHGFLEYATALFDAETVQRFVRQLRVVLRCFVDVPETPVAGSPLSDSEAAWPAANEPTGETRAVWTRIREHIESRSNAVAVVAEDATLTYRELGNRVSAAAALLRRAGVRQGDRVVVHIERGAVCTVAMLAIWWCGAIYVPVDPELPVRRRELIAGQARPVLTVCSDPDTLPDSVRSGSARVIDARELLDAPPVSMSPTPQPADAVAYLMYTSGSTGEPKGIGVTHANLAYFLDAMVNEIGLGPEDRLLALTTTAFDISLLELLGPLIVGATVSIAPQRTLRDGAELATLLGDSSITLAQATPATWRMALQSGWRPRPGFQVLCGGETMPRDLAKSLTECTRSVWNLYGPTETTVWSCAARLRPEGVVHLGFPLAGTTVAVVDQELSPVPVGVCGELVIGGPGVAAGYAGRPALTAARFLPDPSGNGRRVYRTGDIVRRRPDGSLQYVGRADEQVKVRGHRIELGDVENALRSADGVADAAAAILGTGTQAVLGAFLVPACGREPTAEWVATVRRHCTQQLPPPAVPGRYYVLSDIPLTPNGKVHRRALPQVGEPLELTTERIAPRDETERVVAEIWKDLLGRKDFGVTDDFFALGGHSLLVSQLLQRLRTECGVSVPVADIFMDPTIERIASSITASRGRFASDVDPVDVSAKPVDWDFEAIARSRAQITTADSSIEVSDQ